MATKQASKESRLMQSQERIDNLYHEQYMKDQVDRVKTAREQKEAEKKAAEEEKKP